jgi:uncharacterized protein YqgV (UPF0045/DUF77 family)
MQIVSCQFSVYPLGASDLSEGIGAALAAVQRRGLSVELGAMSSIMTGTSEEVFAALRDAFEAASSGACVLVATVSNACPTSRSAT